MSEACASGATFLFGCLCAGVGVVAGASIVILTQKLRRWIFEMNSEDRL